MAFRARKVFGSFEKHTPGKIANFSFLLRALSKAGFHRVVPNHLVRTDHGVWLALDAVNVACLVKRILEKTFRLNTTDCNKMVEFKKILIKN